MTNHTNRAGGTIRYVALVAVSLMAFAALQTVGGHDAGADRLPDAVVVAPYVAGGVCLPRNTPDQLDTLFATEPGGVAGADYQRAIALPDGNVLWTFQDAEVRLPGGRLTLVHNIAMVQTGSCFTVLMTGSARNPRPWIFADATVQFRLWYWPLDSVVGADGLVYVFAAEMNEAGPDYLTEVTPTATLVAAFDPTTWNIVSQGFPADNSDALYGWSAESAGDWTYLYAHCFRQFGHGEFFDVLAHDFSCSADVTVARIPRGRVFDTPTYWTARGWSTDRSAATPVIPTDGRLVNATDIIRHDNHWLAITKVNDWFGDTIVIDAAPRPVGPFTTIATIVATPRCDPGACNTYFASWIPTPAGRPQVIGLSNNRWDGVFSSTYRPTFSTVATPAYRMSAAERCTLGYCG